MNPVVYKATPGNMNLSLGVKIKDEGGDLVYDGCLSFSGGTRVPGRGIIPGVFATTDKHEINCLDNHPANKANGGDLFEKIESEADLKRFKATVEIDEDIDKFQMARDYILKNYPDINSSEVSSKIGMKDTLEKLGISFKNFQP